jgi:hypothetical protein
MRAFATVLVTGSLIVTVFGGVALAQEPKSKALQLKDLPPSVRKTVQENLKGGAIKAIAKEKEDGIEQYEIETTLNDRARDFNVAVDGRLLVVEEATTIDAIPAAAKAAILKKVGGGTVTTVETFAKPGQRLLYEAAYKDAKGKRHEMLVNTNGQEVRE